MIRNKQNSKNPPPRSAEVLLHSISHYIKKPKTQAPTTSFSEDYHISDESTELRMTKYNDPFGKYTTHLSHSNFFSWHFPILLSTLSNSNTWFFCWRKSAISVKYLILSPSVQVELTFDSCSLISNFVLANASFVWVCRFHLASYLCPVSLSFILVLFLIFCYSVFICKYTVSAAFIQVLFLRFLYF